MRIKPLLIFLGNLLLLLFSLLFILALKQGATLQILEQYKESLFLFLFVWVIVSFLVRKYRTPVKQKNLLVPISRILVTSGVVLGIITTFMYLFRVDYYSRFIVFGTLLSLTVLEVIFCAFYYAFRNASLGEPVISVRKRKIPLKSILTVSKKVQDERFLLEKSAFHQRKKALLKEVNKEVYEFLTNYIPIESANTHITSTLSHRNIDLLSNSNINVLINLERINDIRYINKFFESVNRRLPEGGVFFNFLETKNQRKKRILRKFPPVINYIYYFFDFILKRIFPKFALTKGIYFLLTRGNNRVLTKAEAYGRLFSCGFEIIDELESDGMLYFFTIKAKKPLYPEQASYGPLIKLERVGKNGKLMKVYKLRTMHPYSEFLQDYVYKKEGLKDGGKFKSDFRVSNLGRFFRIFWLDELPMLINLLKRDLKIVGVRPISKHYFDLYTVEHKERRIKYTPGLVPPFYVDNPKTLNEIIASEKKYFDAYDMHPLLTDINYFFSALYNIIFKKARSA